MKSKLLASLIALYGLTSFAVDPVAVWSGDFNETTKGDYTLSANGNTVAADGSSITISTAKGVSVKKTTGGNIGDQASTVIIKYTNFTPPTNSDAQVLIMNHTANTSYKDFIGAASISGGNIHGIWQNTTWGANKTTSGAYGSAATDTKTFAFTWAQTGANIGAYFWIDGASKSGWGSLHGNLQIDGIWVGGPNESTTLKPATGMKVLAIAVFDSRISDAEIAAYEFPQKLPGVISLNICNGLTADAGAVLAETETMAGTIPANAWQNICDTQQGGLRQGSKTGIVAWTGSQSTTLADASVTWSCSNNDMANLYKDVTTSIPFLKCYYSRANQSGLNGPVTFTITGIPYSSYDVIVYLSGNSAEKNPNQSIRVNDSLYYGGTVDAEHKYGTYAGSSTSWGAVANQNAVEYGKNVIRVEGQTSSTAVINLDSPIEKWGIAAIQIVEMSAETEESEETETTNYNFNKFLTDSYQDTGWSVTLEEILEYGLFAGTMDGNYVSGSNVPAQGFYKKTGTDGSVSVVEFQMQIYQEGSSASDKYLKATRVYAKEQGGTIWLRAVSSGNVQYGTLGTEVTSWNGTLAKAADQSGYGVASVALSITKPVDKSVKGTIDEVTTEHSEDYTSNTITAKVTIENKGEYKGDAVLVYALGETQYVGEIAEGSAAITVAGLTQEKVYRGTLALGQKIGETVTVIEGTEMPVALYQGERQYMWMASPIVIKEATTINSGEGCTAPVPTDMPDYVENCDSVFTVSISAAEAVSEENDTESLEGVQGGVRIAEVGGALKLQVVKNGVWTVFSDAEINKTYTMTVTFHYAKDENDTDPAVSYVLDKTTETSAKMTDKTKVTEVFIADGTVLPADLTGRFQFDSAVIVDLELKPGEGDYVDYTTEEAALAAVEKLKIGICDAVKSVLTTETQQSAYRAYFHLVVVSSPSGEGLYAVMPELKDEVKSAIEEDLEKALADVVNAFNTGSAEIVGKPGLYYGVKSGEDITDLTTGELKMADADGKVSITITKPEGASKHFYRIICSPTPASNK